MTADKAFLCLSMLNTVHLSMTHFFPCAIGKWGEMRASIKRIQVKASLFSQELIVYKGFPELGGARGVAV